MFLKFFLLNKFVVFSLSFNTTSVNVLSFFLLKLLRKTSREQNNIITKNQPKKEIHVEFLGLCFY